MPNSTSVIIDISQVPKEKQNRSDFLALLANMKQGCADPNIVKAICIHEAAHAFFLGHAGMIDPSASGPRILYDPVKDEFDGHGSSVKFGGWDQQYVKSLDSRDWLGRVAKGYAAGGIAARVLANSFDKGDEEDRENFDTVFKMVKATNPGMTWTADSLWALAQKALETDFQRSDVKEPILALADALKPDLFRVS